MSDMLGEPTFEDFWRAYPRRVGRGAAVKSWDKMTRALKIAPSDLRARVRCSEILSTIGYRDTDPARRKRAFEEARDLAGEALKTDSLSADANYVMALALSRLTEAATYLEVAPLVVRVAPDAPVGDFHDALPTAPADPDALAELTEQWGLGTSVRRLLAALGG